MPALHTLHVALNEALVRYVGDQVASGRYPTASAVVRAALRMMIADDGTAAARPSAADLSSPDPEPSANA